MTEPENAVPDSFFLFLAIVNRSGRRAGGGACDRAIETELP